MKKVLAALAVTCMLATTGCGPKEDKPIFFPGVPSPTTPTAPPTNIGKPGAYCDRYGERGLTTTGEPIICNTTSTDTRYRWRTA